MIWPFSLFFGKKKPKPKPAPPPTPPTPPTPLKRPIRMGVSQFPGWRRVRSEFGAVPGTQCPSLEPWKDIHTEDRKFPGSEDGTYDESDPEVTRVDLAHMAAGAINYVIRQVEWAHEHTRPERVPSWIKPLASPLLMSHTANAHLEVQTDVKFAFAWWNVMAGAADRDGFWDRLADPTSEFPWGNGEMEASFRMFAECVATQYMRSVNYLRIMDRPVLFLGYIQDYTYFRRFGVSTERAIKIISSTIEGIIGRPPFLVATATPLIECEKLKNYGIDAFTQYLLEAPSLVEVLATYHWYWERSIEICKRTGLFYVVPYTAGYDPTAWDIPGKTPYRLTAKDFEEHIRDARKVALEQYQHTLGYVCGYAWDENGEGGVVKPMAEIPGNLHFGDEMLQAHRRACE